MTPPLQHHTALLLLALPTSSNAADSHLNIQSANDVVTRWDQNQHLYVKGDLGIPATRLAEFQAWLSTNAPNWTVVLMRDAAGESYRDPAGTSYQGIDAVEFQLGQQLPQSTGFGDLTDPRSGEPNGAFFILFLAERKFAYFASATYDRRQLGEDHWVGNLDQPAIRAMRGGARILDAAKDTIQNIDSRLASHFPAEPAHVSPTRESPVQSSRSPRSFSYLPAAALLALGGILFVLYRRKRTWKAKALGLLQDWDRTMAEKRDALFVLLDRTNLVVGSSTGADDGSLEGETLRLAKETVRDVDELFIMSSSVDHIIDRAESLAKPHSPLRSLAQFFSTSPYKKAIRLLSDEPVSFSPDEPLRLIIRGREMREDSEKLLGKIGDYPPFSLTFTDLIAEFDRRATRALVAVDLLESSWEEITGALESLELAASKLDSAAADLTTAASADGLFDLPSIRAVLIPAVKEGMAGAAEVGRKDPVEALRTWVPATLAQSEEAISLCQSILSARSDIFPTLASSSDTLHKLGRLPHWIRDSLASLSTHADALAAKAVDDSIFEDAQKFAADLTKLGEDATRATELAARAHGPAPASIADSRSAVAAAKTQLARDLDLPESALLAETPESNPSRHLDDAEAQIAAAQAAIDQGDVLAADANLAETDRLVAHAHHLVRITKEAFSTHHARLNSLRDESALLADTARERSQILEGLRSKFAPSALHLTPGHEDAGISIANHDSLAGDALTAASQAIARSASAHRSGRILEAAADLDQASDQHANARHLLDQIRDHAAALSSLESKNRRDITSLSNRTTSSSPTMDDPKIMVRTRKIFVDAVDLLERAREAAAPPHGPADPFSAADLIAATLSKLDEADASVQDDRRCHAAATRSLTAAAAQIDDCQRLVREASSDRIPDSHAITDAADALDQLAAQHASAAHRLEIPHGDWPAVQTAADQISAAAARAAAILRAEIESAQSALAALDRAARAVQSATAWRGSHGVRISGEPGSESLDLARRALRMGKYPDTLQHAGRATSEADSAVSHANAEVAALLDEERRRAEDALRRRRSQAPPRSPFSSQASLSAPSLPSAPGPSPAPSISSSPPDTSPSPGTRSSEFTPGSGTSRSGW